MVITLHLEKLQPGLYRASALCGKVLVTRQATYGSLEDAIREEAQAIPDGFAWFADVEYGGASSGTIPLKDLPARAADVAAQLVGVVAQMHAITESAAVVQP